MSNIGSTSEVAPDNSRVEDQRLAELVAAVVEGSLGESDRSDLEKILESSDAAKRYYLRYVQIESELASQWDAGHSISLAREQSPSNSTRQKLVVPALCMLLVATAAALLLTFFPMGRDRTPDDLASEFRSLEGGNDPGLGVAIVVQTRGLEEDSEIRVGRRLPAGLFQLSQGEVLLHFVSGATVALQGPSQLEIESEMLATLLSGSATTRVSESAKGFVLNSPGAAVVDLGTEFRMSVDSLGKSVVEVIDGEVELSLLGDDGTTLTSRQLAEREMVAVSPKEMRLTDIKSFEPAAPMVRPFVRPLAIDEDYVSLVKSRSPIAYWRFESFENNRLVNEVADGPIFSMQRSPEEPRSVTVAQGHVRFRRSGRPRFFVTQPLLSGLMTNSHSVEAWIAPDDLRHASFLSLFPSWSQFGYEQFTLLEIATDTSWVHQPGSIRFLSRYPPARSSARGLNLFSAGLVTPGQWHHIVTTSTESKLSLFINGTLVREIENRQEQPRKDEPLRCLIGQLTLDQIWRQFSGRMDEVAIYRHALSADEILEHYSAVDLNKERQ